MIPSEHSDLERTVPGHNEISDALEALRLSNERLSAAYAAVELRMSSVDATDAELAYHALFLKEAGETAEELKKKAASLDEANAQRFMRIVVPRGVDGILVFGKRFRVDSNLIPKTPKYGTEEHAAMIEWLKASEFAGAVKVEVPWKSMQSILNTLSERGLPFPPHVDTYVKPKVYIR